jgi:ankyrin repeat protein
VWCCVDVNARSLALKSSGQLEHAIEGPTALHCLVKAMFWWQLEAIEFLVKNGANVNSKNEIREIPLHIASLGYNPIANRLKYSSTVGDFSGFWKSAALKILLDLGADPNVLDNHGLSCLHKASSSPERMKIPLQNGADISIGKVSPLFTAIRAHDL